MRKLSGQDASFLYMETPTVHMHTVGTTILDPSTSPKHFDFRHLKRVVASRMHLLPPFRRRGRSSCDGSTEKLLARASERPADPPAALLPRHDRSEAAIRGVARSDRQHEHDLFTAKSVGSNLPHRFIGGRLRSRQGRPGLSFQGFQQL
jgi:hypothetical protein